MVINEVLSSTKAIVDSARYVFIDDEKIEETAQAWAKEDLELPRWDAPVFPAETNDTTIDHFMIGNAINFAYSNFKTGEKWVKEVDGVPWPGAFGMWAALNKARNDGVPILDANYLSQISLDDMREIFSGNIEMPMIHERTAILRDVGRTLHKKYDGRFYNLFTESNHRLFNQRKGIVERLISDFSSFDDSYLVDGKRVRFDKRAQLGAGMVLGRFQDDDSFYVEDVDSLTVFADYNLPKCGRTLGFLQFSDDLAQRIDAQEVILAGSQEELEIRAATVHSFDRILHRINEIRDGVNPVNALHLDYRGFSAIRKDKKYNHHLTVTIAY